MQTLVAHSKFCPTESHLVHYQDEVDLHFLLVWLHFPIPLPILEKKARGRGETSEFHTY